MITKIKPEKKDTKIERVRVRVIKAPLVDTEQLNHVIRSRTHAVVL